jgi:hypothetical protein
MARRGESEHLMPLPYRLGSHGPEILSWQKWFKRYASSYAPPIDGYYGSDEAKAVSEMRRRLKMPPGDFDAALAARVAYVYVPERAIPRVPTYVFRGTGGIIGEDIVSRVCQRLGPLVEEINTPYVPTMGGIPVGATEGGIGAKSMWKSIIDGFEAFKVDFLRRYRENVNLKICIMGYSAGAICAQMCRDWILTNYPQCYVASVTFGDPTRPVGGGFFGQPAPWGDGIADFTYGDPHDYRHAWLTHEKDMYAQIPGGVVGDIMDDVYAEVARFAFTDIFQFTARMVTVVPTVAAKAGISIPGALGALAGGIPGLIGFAFPLLLGSIGGLIPLGTPADQLTGTAAAAKAAMLGLEFLFAGTGPHVRYDFDPAWPGGPTFTDFAVMHFRDYIGRLAVTA